MNIAMDSGGGLVVEDDGRVPAGGVVLLGLVASTVAGCELVVF